MVRHVERRDDDYVRRRLLEMQLPRKRKRRRPKRRHLDVVKEDMQLVGAREDEVFDWSVWRIHCGDT